MAILVFPGLTTVWYSIPRVRSCLHMFEVKELASYAARGVKKTLPEVGAAGRSETNQTSTMDCWN